MVARIGVHGLVRADDVEDCEEIMISVGSEDLVAFLGLPAIGRVMAISAVSGIIEEILAILRIADLIRVDHILRIADEIAGTLLGTRILIRTEDVGIHTFPHLGFQELSIDQIRFLQPQSVSLLIQLLSSEDESLIPQIRAHEAILTSLEIPAIGALTR